MNETISLSTLPVLQVISNEMQEVTAQHSVYYPMVIRQREVHFMTNSNRVAFRSFYDSRFLSI